ncbi:hypothetical protein MZO44_15710, partial [Lactiplantibacillus sp. E932]|nr:hypothetical protein [Lactiplantibacillus sp. E932]
MLSKNNIVISSPYTAVGSSDHPVLVDQGSSAEMEAIGLLERDLPGPGTRHCIFSINNFVVAADYWLNGRHSTTQSG